MVSTILDSKEKKNLQTIAFLVVFSLFFLVGNENWTINVKRKKINENMACALAILFDDGDNATKEANLDCYANQNNS